MPIGRSRSVSARRPRRPARRARLAAIADVNALDDRADDPEQRPDRGDADGAGADDARLGPERRCHQRLRSPAEPAISAAHRRRCGTSTAQVISIPTTMAMPTAMPTRWPTPISAMRQAAPKSPLRARADAERVGGRVGQQAGLGER